MTERLEEERDGHGRGDREEPAAPTADHRPDADHDADVDGGEPGRKQAVDHRAIDDDIDLVQPVFQDGDGERGRHAEEHQDRRGQEHSGRDGGGITATGGQSGDREDVGQQRQRGHERDPLDLLAKLAAPRPIANDERHERGGDRERDDPDRGDERRRDEMGRRVDPERVPHS